jgi:16S rRNA G966 N2-methylase RsmD
LHHSYNYNNPVDPYLYEKEATEILKSFNEEYGWMYETTHNKDAINVKTGEPIEILESASNIKGKINFSVWSDVLICPYCNNEYVFFDLAFDRATKKVKKKYICKTCNAEIEKKNCKKSFETHYDSVNNEEISIAKEELVLINYSIGKDSFEKEPDEFDFHLLKKINEIEVPYWFPQEKIPNGPKIDEPKRSHGINFVHQFYSHRSLISLAKIFDILKNNHSNVDRYLLYTFEQSIMGMAKINRYAPTHFSQVNRYLNGTLYIGSLRSETSLEYLIKNKIKRLIKLLQILNESFNAGSIVTNQSTTDLKNIPSNSVDYIFVDPPFGANLMYSELSFLWESWLKIFTNNKEEAIINSGQNKGINEYTELMTASFKEMNRILKPNRWLTIEFHNTKAIVWNSIQEAIAQSGFIIAQVSVLNKKQGTFNQVSAPGSVKNDLIINAYKPKEEFLKRFIKNAGEGMEFDFIKEQLEHLSIIPSIERTEKMLYSKMLAHYVENGYKIRYNSNNFYKLLYDNFVDLDGYWFIETQVNDYNKWKSNLSIDQLKEILDGQQILLITDERSAITWIYNFLKEPKEFTEIHSNFQPISRTIHDDVPELIEILNKNFILENNRYRRPLDQKEQEKINKNREKELDRAFNKLLKEAKTQKGKIKEIRREALVHGFTKCYQEGRYQDILTIADKLYTSTLESSGDIMDFVDIARIKTQGSEDL